MELTPELETFIRTKLSNKLWRLNNLYHIIDKNGKLRLLRLNQSQLIVMQNFKHNKKIILKTRQQGITTMMVADNLDNCLFRPGFSAGVQSYGMDEGKKLHDKARLMWDMFDKDILKLLGLTLTADNSHGLQFSNGSNLKVGNFRGDTLQSLHVSELAKIAKKYPEKAMELKTGAFQAIGKDNTITVESTAEGKQGMFYDMWVKAKEKEKLVKEGVAEYTPFDFQAIFLPWTWDNDCRLAMPVPITEELETYFKQVEDALGETIDDEQRWWYAAKLEELGDKMKQEYPSTPDEAFLGSVSGTYYENEFKLIKIEEREHDTLRLVHMACDLGMNDSFVLLFFQVLRDGWIYIIDEHVDNGKTIDEYNDVRLAAAKRYKWTTGSTYCPFDAKQRELIAGVRLDRLKKLGFNPIIVKKHQIVEGISEVRAMLRHTIIHPRCKTLLSAIQNYRKKFDDKYQVFLDAPVHDEHSHPADALRYLAMGLKTKPLTLNFIADKQNLSSKYYYNNNIGLDL